MELADLNLTIQLIVFRIVAMPVIAAVQGGSVAAAAVLLGDRGPKYDGRLTVAPAGHIDLVGAFSLIIFGNGWGRPVAIDAREFRIGRTGVVVVILAGFVALLVLAAIFDLLVLPALTMLPHTMALTASAFLKMAGSLSIWFALLGLVPIPPLTGGLLLEAFGVRVPRQAQWILVAVVLAGVATGLFRELLGPAHAALASIILGR